MKKVLLLCVVGFLLLVGLAVRATAQTSPRVYFEPTPLILEAVSSTGTVEVRLGGVSEISAFDIEFSYDTNKFRVDGVEFSSALGGSAVGPEIDNEAGLVSFGAWTLERGANDDFINILGGQQLLATISLTAVGEGKAPLPFTWAEMLGTTADAGEEPPSIEVGAEDGLVQVGTSPGPETVLHSGGNRVVWPASLTGFTSFSALESIADDCGSVAKISRKKNGWWESAVHGYGGVGFALSEGNVVYIRVVSGCVWSP